MNMMRCDTMNVLQSLYTKQHKRMKSLYIGHGGDTDTQFLIIRLDHSWILKLMARAAILALIIVSFPWISSMIGDLTLTSSYKTSNVDMAFNPMDVELLPLIFKDLANEGLLRMGDRSLLVSNCVDEDAIYGSRVVNEYKTDYVSVSDLAKQNVVADESYDFVFAYGFGFPHSSTHNFIERALKVGGVMVVQLSDNPMVAFPHLSNYKIVYVRRFDSIIVAMRKTGYESKMSPSITTTITTTTQRRRLLSIAMNAKQNALQKLEDVLLEPPRGKSSRYMKRTRYLPDLMGVPLETYPRRVFIDVGLQDKKDANGDSTWFSKNYPTRNTKFEIFKIETVTEEASGKEVPSIGMSEWLENNVKENEYVVMKAEAEVVEEMVKSKSIRLVDELFMECKHQGIKKGDRKSSRRPYWECLSLYGMLRDEGIAVHQWWG